MSDSASQRDFAGQKTIQTGHNLWFVLPLITSAALAQGLMKQGLPVFYPFIQNEFGLSHAQVGLISASMAAGTALTVVLTGWLTDIFGVKRMITVALLSLTAFTLVFPLAYSFPLILGLVVIIGIVSSPLNLAITRAVIDWFPIRIRASAMSVKQMGIPSAGALSAALLPMLVLATGWRTAVAVTGLLVLAIAITFILLYRDAPQGSQAESKFSLASLKTMLRHRSLMVTMIWGSTLIGFQHITLSYFMLFLIEKLELSPITAGGLLAIAQVSSIIARVLWGAISDFIFHGRRTVVLAFTGFLTILWMLGASSVDVGVPISAIYLMAIVIGISTLSFHGVLLTYIGEQAEPGQMGVTLGIAIMAIQASQIVMPPLFGYLVDISSSYSLGWRTTAVITLVCTAVLLAFGRRKQHR
ncbi:MFS transporter [Chloroflexota bacterium]